MRFLHKKSFTIFFATLFLLILPVLAIHGSMPQKTDHEIFGTFHTDTKQFSYSQYNEQQDFCTSEMLGQQSKSLAFTKQRQLRQNIFFDVFLFPVLFALLFPFFSFIQRIFSKKYTIFPTFHIQLLTYIHNKDGKKENR